MKPRTDERELARTAIDPDFESIGIEDNRVIAVVPQSEFVSFFVKRAPDEGLLDANDNGVTGVTPSSEVRIGSVAAPIVVAWLSWRSSGRISGWASTRRCGWSAGSSWVKNAAAKATWPS